MKESTDVILIVGGGIKTPESASKVVASGADIVVTGTLVETSTKLVHDMSSLISSINS